VINTAFVHAVYHVKQIHAAVLIVIIYYLFPHLLTYYYYELLLLLFSYLLVYTCMLHFGCMHYVTKRTTKPGQLVSNAVHDQQYMFLYVDMLSFS